MALVLDASVTCAWLFTEEPTAAIALLRRLNVMVSPYTSDPARLAELGVRHGLTAYDALYLDHALALNADLASLDQDLRAAAVAEGLAVRPAGGPLLPDSNP